MMKFLIIRRKFKVQYFRWWNVFWPFYKSGLTSTQFRYIWLGFEIPCWDFRIIITKQRPLTVLPPGTYRINGVNMKVGENLN